MTVAAKTPPQYAKYLSVNPDKVLAWIKSGELRAINVATSRSSRPRWRITPEAAEAFEASRGAVVVKPKPRKRNKRDDKIIQYF